MLLEIDPDLKAVAEFMQSNVPTAKLVSVAESLSAVAPLLWGDYDRQAVAALELKVSPTMRE